MRLTRRSLLGVRNSLVGFFRRNLYAFFRGVFDAIEPWSLDNNRWSRLASLVFWLSSRTKVVWSDSANLFRVQTGEDYIFVARRKRLKLFLNGIQWRFGSLSDSYGLSWVPDGPSGLVVDVGANIGEFSRILADRGNHVVAIEPDPEEFRALTSNLGSEANCFQSALWSKKMRKTLFYANDSGDTSLFRPESRNQHEQNVTTVTLDEILETIGRSGEGIKILKLEAEGAEPEVLLGAKKALERTEWILADLGFERGAEKKSTVSHAASILLPLGFEIIDILPKRLVVVFRRSSLENTFSERRSSLDP